MLVVSFDELKVVVDEAAAWQAVAVALVVEKHAVLDGIDAEVVKELADLEDFRLEMNLIMKIMLI
jgi:hypothetical protein